ncbi:MAG: hypothetical protein KC620_06215 [Myxococcales bacterium]|nr:hypothetical protein [Myxococcales bacterium]
MISRKTLWLGALLLGGCGPVMIEKRPIAMPDPATLRPKPTPEEEAGEVPMLRPLTMPFRLFSASPTPPEPPADPRLPLDGPPDFVEAAPPPAPAAPGGDAGETAAPTEAAPAEAAPAEAAPAQEAPAEEAPAPEASGEDSFGGSIRDTP